MTRTQEQIDNAILPASSGKELLAKELDRIETIAERAVRRLSTNKRSIVGSVAELVAAGQSALVARQPVGVAIWREGINLSNRLRTLWHLTPELDPKSYAGWLETDSGKNAVSLLASALPEKCRSLVPCLLAGLTVPQSAKATGVCARTIKSRRAEIRQEAHRVAEIQDRLLPLFVDDNPLAEPDRHCRSLSHTEWLRVAFDFSRIATAGHSRRMTSVPRVATIRPDAATLTEYQSDRAYGPSSGLRGWSVGRIRPQWCDGSAMGYWTRKPAAQPASKTKTDGRTDDDKWAAVDKNEQLAMVSRPPQQPLPTTETPVCTIVRACRSGLPTQATIRRLADRYVRGVRNWLDENALDGVC